METNSGAINMLSEGRAGRKVIEHTRLSQVAVRDDQPESHLRMGGRLVSRLDSRQMYVRDSIQVEA
ncbi:MAG: hypothetical protein Pars92KO_24970 [Parasphingorhabdus sp.]